MGLTVSDATADLEAKGFEVASNPVVSGEVADPVISQGPAAGGATKGSTLQPDVARGPATDTTTTDTTATPSTQPASPG